MSPARRYIETYPARLVFITATAIALIIYLLTTSTTVAFMDAGEFALRAHQLGATHSPGAPLFVLIAHLFGLLVPNPAYAANLVSVFSASLTAGLLGLLLYDRTQVISLSIAGALAFALIYTNWSNAVLSEAYALSILLFACSLLSASRWYKSEASDFPRSDFPRSNFPWAVPIFYGFALAANFALILLVPAYLVLFFLSGSKGAAYCCRFVIVVFLFVVIISVFNMVLAANYSAFGAVSPDSFATLLLYMSGSQHDPLAVHGLGYFLNRLSEHFWIFARQYWLIFLPVGCLGAIRLYIEERVTGLFLGSVFVIYMGYFTLFGSADYFLMVAPAYFVFSIWVALGLVYLATLTENRLIGASLVLLLMCAALLSLVSQFSGRYRDARAAYAERYVLEAFSIIPEGSVVIAGWNEFTALNYMQSVENIRPDLKLIVPALDAREYEFGEVADYLSFVAAEICDSPVVTNKLTEELLDGFDYVSLESDSEWYEVKSKVSCADAG